MAHTIDINQLVEGGRNTESRLLKITWDAEETITVPHGLDFDPLWVESVHCKEQAQGTPMPTDYELMPVVVETGGTSLAYACDSTPGARQVYLHLSAPAAGTTPTGYWKLHVGRTHSTSR